ncbi:MAG: PAS domain S-box-containing protein [Paraglaciecola sp.]|jgi:PAS domain S-box-containing protein
MKSGISKGFGQTAGANNFEGIFRSSNEGIFVADAQGQIKLANPKSETMFGYELGELIGKSIDTLVPREVRPNHAVYRKMYEGDPQPRIMGIGRDLLGMKKDGTNIPIEVSLSHIDVEGAFHVVAFVIDITKRKEMQQKLEKSETQLIAYATELENRVKKRTEDLNRTVKKLEQTNIKLQKEIKEREKAEQAAIVSLQKERELNELKSRFVSTASHEFRTPLSSILSSASLISKYMERQEEAKAEKHVKKIKLSVKNLTDILNDFLSLGKLEEGKQNIILSEVSMHHFLQEVVSEIEGVFKAGQTVKVMVASEEISCFTDEKLLRHTLINLLSNASKYSGEDAEITLTAEETSSGVSIKVVDEGIGIPESEQLHLFERFFRAKNATNIQGTGLGLNIVKKHIELLNGEVTFDSKLNEGTTFTITIPNHNSPTP